MNEITRHFTDELTSKLETADLRLVSSLLAMGVRLLHVSRVVRVADDLPPTKNYQFAERSEDGKYETGALLKAWTEGARWIEANPEHPWAYVMAAHLNHLSVLRDVRTMSDLVFVQKGKRVALLASHADAKTEEAIMKGFKR